MMRKCDGLCLMWVGLLFIKKSDGSEGCAPCSSADDSNPTICSTLVDWLKIKDASNPANMVTITASYGEITLTNCSGPVQVILEIHVNSPAPDAAQHVLFEINGGGASPTHGTFGTNPRTITLAPAFGDDTPQLYVGCDYNQNGILDGREYDAAIEGSVRYSINLDIEQSEANVCSDDTSETLNLPAGSCVTSGGVTWQSTPAGISGSGTSVTFNPSSLTPGVYTVTAQDDGEPSETDTCVVRVLKVELSISQYGACDGQSVNVDLAVTPSSMESLLSLVTVVAYRPDGLTTYGNPSGQGITLSQRGAITQWKIDNTRWYSTQSDDCNDTSDYEIKALANFGGSVCETEPITFTAQATLGTCLDGQTALVTAFSGAPAYVTVYNSTSGLYETTATVGTFKRDMKTTSTWTVDNNSQYYQMVTDEELYHANQQMKNSSHMRWGTAFLMENVMNAVTAGQPYTDGSSSISRMLAEVAFKNAGDAEIARSLAYVETAAVSCADETEAKSAVGASYKVDMPCTYPGCP